MMFKRYTIIFLLYTGYAILLIHNIIPHHHHDEHHEISEQHIPEHLHADEHEEHGLLHLFSHILHSADAFTIAKTNVSKADSNPFLQVVAILHQSIVLQKPFAQTLVFDSGQKNPLYAQVYSTSCGLRGPPGTIK